MYVYEFNDMYFRILNSVRDIKMEIKKYLEDD